MLPRKDPFRIVNRFNAHEPSTSSGITRGDVQQVEQPWINAKDVLVLKETNNLQQNNLKSDSNKTVVELEKVNNIELIQKMKKEYSKILNHYQRKSKTVSDKIVEIVTPRIENVFTEAQDPLRTEKIVQPSRSSLGSNKPEVINADQEDILCKLSEKPEISLLPRTTDRMPLNIGKI